MDRLDVVAENAIAEAPAVYEIRVSQLKAAIRDSAGAEEALRAIDSLRVNTRFLRRISNLLLDSMQTADALARSHIIQMDVGESVRLKKFPAKRFIKTWLPGIGQKDWFICDDGIVKVSFNLIPEEVVKYIRYKALTIAGVEDGELLQAVKDRLAKSVRDGLDFKQFKQEIDRMFDEFGVTRIDTRHLQTVFRTNVFSSYSIAQLDQVKSMADRFPLWKYSAILDNRTRPLHRELNGNVYRVGEGPIPPIDYNCRCTAQYLHAFEVEREGLKPLDWKGNPQIVRFNVRSSFESWVKDRQSSITPGAQGWINDNL